MTENKTKQNRTKSLKQKQTKEKTENVLSIGLLKLSPGYCPRAVFQQFRFHLNSDSNFRPTHAASLVTTCLLSHYLSWKSEGPVQEWWGGSLVRLSSPPCASRQDACSIPRRCLCHLFPEILVTILLRKYIIFFIISTFFSCYLIWNLIVAIYTQVYLSNQELMWKMWNRFFPEGVFLLFLMYL